MATARPRQPEQVQQFFTRAGQLDRASPVPLYYQLQERLKVDLDAGHWEPGDVLPSESEIEAHFEVSRTVIRKALDVLEADGQVVRHKGRGVLVAQPKLQYDAVSRAGDWQADPERRTVLAEVIDVRLVPAGRNLAALLDVPATDRLFEITAVAAAGEPVSLTQAYVRCDASPELAAAAGTGSALPLEVGGPELLPQLADRCGLRLHHSELSVEATTANEFECSTLHIRPRATTLLVGTVVRDAAGSPLAFLRSVVRSDHFRFTATVQHVADGLSRP
jgi:GntR family transcriptional regulator, N-acetylglucosamine utilization regulator